MCLEEKTGLVLRIEAYSSNPCTPPAQNTKADPSRGMYINAILSWGKAKDMEIMNLRMLVDSGASLSLLSEDAFAQIPSSYKPVLEATDTKIRLADGGLRSCTGVVRIPLYIADQEHEVMFLVGKFSDPALLGMRDLQAIGMVIDFHALCLSVGGFTIPATDVDKIPLLVPAVLHRGVDLSPGSQQCVELRVVSSSKAPLGTLLFQPYADLLFDFSLIAVRSIHHTESNIFTITITNPTEISIQLEPGFAAGSVEYISSKEVHFPDAPVVACVSVAEVVENVDVSLPAHLQEMFEGSIGHLAEDEVQKFRSLLIQHQHVFSKNNFDIGHNMQVEHNIETNAAKPIKQSPRRQSPEQRNATDAIIDELLTHELISPSKSPWASPIVMVKKRTVAIACVSITDH